MTVPSELSSVGFTGNGSVSSYSIPFVFYDVTDLVVTDIDDLGAETVMVLDTDYTLTGGNGDDGTITFTTTPPSGRVRRVDRVVSYSQQTNFATSGSFDPFIHEAAFDRQTMQSQQVVRRVAALEDSLEFQAVLTAINAIPDILTDLEDWQNQAGILNIARTWTALQTFSAGATFGAQSLFSEGIKTAKTNPNEAHWVSDSRPPGAQLRFQLAGWYIHAGTSVKARIFSAESGAGGRLEISINCDWDGTNWIADQTDNASLYCFDGTSFHVYRKSTPTAGATWTVAQWDGLNQVGGGGLVVTPTALTADTGWTAGSTNSAPRYWRDGQNVVHLMGTMVRSGGTISAGAGGTSIVASGGLAAGNRPLAARVLPVQCQVAADDNPHTLDITIATNGSMSIRNGMNLTNTSVVFLDGVSFRAEQ